MRGHLRAGEVTLDHICTRFFNQAGQFLPLLLIFPHDRRNQDLIRVVLFQSPNSSQILLQRMLGNLLHVFEANKAGIFFGEMVKAWGDFIRNKEPDRFKNNAAPTAIIGFGAHFIAVAHRRGREAERVGEFDAAKGNRKIFR